MRCESCKLSSVTTTKHYAIVLGTRPDLIKMAALIVRAQKHPTIKFTVIHTGQHYDKNMSDIFLKELDMPAPDIQLSIEGVGYSERIGKMVSLLVGRLAPLVGELSGVIVLGDTNSVLAGAIAASQLGIPVIHVEAGLRSHDRRMPEELNRVIIDHLSSAVLITEAAAEENLLKEGSQKNASIWSEILA